MKQQWIKQYNGVHLHVIRNKYYIMNEIRELLLNARQHVAVQVNTELLSTYWNVGRIIVEHEQEIRNVPTMASRL